MALKLAHISVLVSNMYTKYTLATHNEYENKKMYEITYTVHTDEKNTRKAKRREEKRKKRHSNQSFTYFYTH